MSEIKTEPAPPTVAPATDTPEMKHVDAYGEFVEESDPCAAYQVNPETQDGKDFIERLKAKAPKPEGVVHSTAPGAHNEPAQEKSDAKTITSKPADKAPSK